MIHWRSMQFHHPSRLSSNAIQQSYVHGTRTEMDSKGAPRVISEDLSQGSLKHGSDQNVEKSKEQLYKRDYDLSIQSTRPRD